MKHVHIDYQFDNKQNRTKVIDRDNYFYHASKLEKTISEISILGTQPTILILKTSLKTIRLCSPLTD